MRSVAIVGFSKQSLAFVENSKADEYWTMNHIIFVDYVKIPRVDRLFEIHKRDWYLRGEIGKAKIYDDWLRKEQQFPIYMQKEELDTELIPSAQPYPLEEICEKLLPNLVRRIGLEEVKIRYFTSTASFMFACAIYEEFDEIQLYGIDMDSDTEYGYQKPCGEFWLGVAVGRGIKVSLPETSTLCSAPIYGYDVVPFVDKLYVKTYLEHYQNKRVEYKKIMDKAAIKLQKNPTNYKAVDSYLSTSSWVYLHDGAITAGARLIQIEDSYISRQAVEMKKAEYHGGMEYWKAIVNSIKGKIDAIGRDSVPDEDWRTYLNARASMYANLGALQLHTKLMRIIDFRTVSPELSMDIIEESDVK